MIIHHGDPRKLWYGGVCYQHGFCARPGGIYGTRPLTTQCSNSAWYQLEWREPFTISLDALGAPNEIEVEKTTREKKNKQRTGCHIWADRRRQGRADYQTRMVKYDRQCLAREAEEDQRREDERCQRECQEHEEWIASLSHNLELEFMLVKGHKVYNTPYANVYTLAKEYEAIQNPTPEQERLQAILQSTALQL
jgi:hypothetical protein